MTFIRGAFNRRCFVFNRLTCGRFRKLMGALSMHAMVIMRSFAMVDMLCTTSRTYESKSPQRYVVYTSDS